MEKKFWANMALSVFIGGCVVSAVTNAGSALTPKGLFRDDAPPCGEAAGLLDKMMLNESIQPMAGGKYQAKFVVTNNSDKDVENILVQCDFYDRSDKDKKFLDREKWLLGGVVKAGEIEPFEPKADKRFIHARAVNYVCVVADMDLFTPPLFTLHDGGGHGGGHGAEGAADHGASNDGHGAEADHGGGPGAHH